ncbi:MAG: SEL1-like repeat protein [Clostridia bacterium]|nr:SEL1-like repeat protein [Clostridia bacterium]
MSNRKKQNKKETQTNLQDFDRDIEILKLKKYIERSKRITGLVALVTAIVSVFATATIININIGTENRPSTTNEALVQAQDYYYSEKYYDALALYQEFANDSEIASINLGYMYSKGLGCTRDYELACDYYKKAYVLGSDEGLENYLAINFLSPNDIESCLIALEYGVEEGNSSAIKYAAFLHTGELFAVSDDTVKNYAEQFLDNDVYHQKEILSSKIVETSQQTRLLEQNYVPKNTEFEEYVLVGTIAKKYVSRYVTKLEQIDDHTYLQVEVPVYSLVIYDNYTIKGLSFEYSDFVFSEKYYKI